MSLVTKTLRLWVITQLNLAMSTPLSFIRLIFCLLSDSFLGRRPTTDWAGVEIVVSRGTILSSKEDDLQVELVPQRLIENRFEISFCCHHIASIRESPASGESMNMRVYREGGGNQTLVTSPPKRSYDRLRVVPLALHKSEG